MPCASTQVALRCLLELLSSWSLCPGVTASTLGAAVDPAFLQHAGYCWTSSGAAIAFTEAAVSGGNGGPSSLAVRSTACCGLSARGDDVCTACADVCAKLKKRASRLQPPVTLQTRIGPIVVSAKAATLKIRIDSLTKVCYRFTCMDSLGRFPLRSCLLYSFTCQCSHCTHTPSHYNEHRSHLYTLW